MNQPNGLLSWCHGFAEDFRKASSSQKLSIIADIISIIGLSFLAVLTAAFEQIRHQKAVTLPGILFLLLIVALMIVVMATLIGFLSWLKSLVDRHITKNPYTTTIYWALQAALWLVLVNLVVALAPTVVPEILRSP
jgi:uncharacterized membrane protein